MMPPARGARRERSTTAPALMTRPPVVVARAALLLLSAYTASVAPLAMVSVCVTVAVPDPSVGLVNVVPAPTETVPAMAPLTIRTPEDRVQGIFGVVWERVPFSAQVPVEFTSTALKPL